MAHQSQLENRKYRNWVKAGLGLKYTKEGLESFCDQLAKQQHVDILKKVQQKHNLMAMSCGYCDIKTLQPDHVRTQTRQCPLGQVNCNCKHPGGKIICPNMVCGAIYDEIIQLHASTPPAPYWKNTDARQWCTEPWAVAKCFINAPGYEVTLKASQVDCSGLLHLLLNNMDFRGHLKCTTDGSDLLQKVQQYRNIIYHSHDMELEDKDVTTYIDDMIAVLQDGKELDDMKESKSAVDKLRELKRDDFVITTTNEAEIRRVIMADAKHIAEKAEKLKHELKQKGKGLSDKLENIGTEQKANLEQKRKEVAEQMESTRIKQKNELEQKAKEASDTVESTGIKVKADLEQKGKEVGDQVESIGTEQKTDLEQKGKEVGSQVEIIASNQKSVLEKKGKEVCDQVENIGKNQKAHLEKKELDIKKSIREDTIKGKLELEQKRKEIIDNIAQKDTQLNTIQRDKTTEPGLMQDELNYDNKKASYQRKMVDDYMHYAIQVSSLPLQPENNQTDIANVYVSPWIAVEMWDERSRQIKENMISVDGIFHSADNTAKNIYVLGEAGSGKTTLCKMLLYYWCVAHSERKANTIESGAVKVMQNYDFIYYVSLRHYSDLHKIEIMLEEIYPDPLLRTILQNESDKCLILLDGLDEWTPRNQRPSQIFTPGLPTRDLHARYTVITTTRRWKFDTLQIKKTEIDKKIKLKGIAETAVNELTEITMKTLNEIFHKNKAAADFLSALKSGPLADVRHVPMILQQLICLWFDDTLRGTSKCAIYSSMLDLFFEWKALKNLETINVPVPFQHDTGPRLPEYLSEYNACFGNALVIYHLSHLAYKTLLARNKENMLIFSDYAIQQLNIPDDVKKYSLKVGILSEAKNINLRASRRQRTSFSFVHKSMQEYLTAVYVAIQFKTMIQSIDDSQKSSDVWSQTCKQCVHNHYGGCKTVADILEQSNVFIMLCGLEPQLLPYISEYIYNISAADKHTIEEKRIAKEEFCKHKNVLKNDIQKCIVSCVSEAIAGGHQFKNSVHIADIVLNPTSDIVSYLHRQIFNLHSVLSVNVDVPFGSNQDKENMYSVLKCPTECDRLMTFRYDGFSSTLTEAADTCIKRTVDIIARNKSTLETVSFIGASEPIVTNLVQIMPCMSQLISFRVSFVIVSHEVCRSLCSILEQSVHLQQIWLGIYCDKYDEHSINLTEHKKLQFIHLQLGSICTSSVNTESLDTCELPVSNLVSMKQIGDSLYNGRKLKHLELFGSFTTRHTVAEARTLTDCLIRLLPTLTSLSTLALSRFTFADNIITRPSDMKNLQEIVLWEVTMSITTWCTFVDGLPTLPLAVHMSSRDMRITENSTMTERDVNNEKAARTYVRKKTESFRVTIDGEFALEFVTKDPRI